MTGAVASAGGKLLLLGEYAVTEGVRALVATVDRSARVEITTLDSGDNLLLAPDIHPEPLPFSLSNDGVQWLAPKTENLELFESVMATFVATMNGSFPARPIKLSLCTREFFDAGTRIKLGLGSSAALTVALQRALHRYFIDPEQDLPHEQQFFQAVDAHQRFQGNLGSGVDIAASVTGGILAYRRAADRPLQMQQLAWPAALKVALVWTGKSASTRIMLHNLAVWRQRYPRQYAHEIAALSNLSEAGASAFEAHRSEDFLEVVGSFAKGLNRLGEKAGIDIFSQEHRHLAMLARENQLFYKPSGAGGGDFGLALGLDDAALETFCQQCEASGYACPPIKINTGLVRIRAPGQGR
jgi:phosphomevalonate kinase